MVLVLDELVHSCSSRYCVVGCAVQPRKRPHNQLLLMMNLFIRATAVPAPTASSIAVMVITYDAEIVVPVVVPGADERGDVSVPTLFVCVIGV